MHLIKIVSHCFCKAITAVRDGGGALLDPSLTWPENCLWLPISWLFLQQPAKLNAWWPLAIEAATAARFAAAVVTLKSLSLHHCTISQLHTPDLRMRGGDGD